MKAHIVRPDELDPEATALWRAFQAQSAWLQSPFFAPEFAQAVGAARADAFVAVLEEANRIVGFFPFHRLGAGVAKPIGGPLSDYQGVIAAPDLEWTGAALLAACGLSAYDFNHAPAEQTALAAGAEHYSRSPRLDLSQGYERYVAERPKSGRHALKDIERRLRKLEREIGPVRFVLHDASDSAWEALVALKSESYARLGVASGFGVPWIAKTFARLRATQNAHFAGLMTAAFVGERMIAGHFGMRSGATWCWWINAYDYEQRGYAPGLIMIREAARRAGEIGVSCIDFGRGEEAYKLVLANAETPLCEGSIEIAGSRAGLLRRAQKAALGVASRIPLGRFASWPRRAFARLVGGVRLPPREKAR